MRHSASQLNNGASSIVYMEWKMPKLRPLIDFVCDTCGYAIDSTKDGYVEWIDNNNIVEQFRIAHNTTRCLIHSGNYGRKDTNLSDFLGDDKFAYILSFLDVGAVLDPHFSCGFRVKDVRNYVEFVRRITIPYYEEARLYFGTAISNGEFQGDNELAIYNTMKLQGIIHRYERP